MFGLVSGLFSTLDFDYPSFLLDALNSWPETCAVPIKFTVEQVHAKLQCSNSEERNGNGDSNALSLSF